MERALVDLAERDGTAVLPGHDPHPAGPAGAVRPSPAGVCRDARARPVAPRRRSPSRQRESTRRGALAGAGYPLDREGVAADLGFDGVTANRSTRSSDRDFVVDALAAAALGMVRLSRLAEEITWWSNPRFGFVRVADAFSTGSSMMPNKRNPDPAELVRGNRPRDRGPHSGPRDPQGPAACLPARPPGGQAAAVRGDRDVGGVARRDGRPDRDADRSTPTGCARRRARATRPRPPSPTRSFTGACRSGRPTTSSGRSSPRRKPKGWRSTRCPIR